LFVDRLQIRHDARGPRQAVISESITSASSSVTITGEVRAHGHGAGGGGIEHAVDDPSRTGARR